jgi:hypothetical protein
VGGDARGADRRLGEAWTLAGPTAAGPARA